MSATPGRLRRRPARVLPALVLAALLILGGTLGVWALGSLLLDGAWPAPLADTIGAVGSQRLDTTPVHVAAALLALLGLVLLLSAVLPGDPGHLTMRTEEASGETAIARRDAARVVRLRVEQVDAVRRARVSMRRHTLHVVVQSPVEDTETVLRRSRAAVDEALGTLRLASDPRVRLRVVRLR